MRRITYILVAAAAAVGITACGANGQTGSTTAAESSTAAESTTEITVNLEEVHKAVQDIYGENYIPNMPYDAAALESLFGVSEDLYEEVIAEGPMISVNIDTFIAVKAKEGKGEEVEKALSAYRKSQVEDAVQYPMNQSKAESSEVIRHGDYVFFVMLGTATDASMEQGEEAALKSAQEENQKAVDVINGFFK